MRSEMPTDTAPHSSSRSAIVERPARDTRQRTMRNAARARTSTTDKRLAPGPADPVSAGYGIDSEDAAGLREIAKNLKASDAETKRGERQTIASKTTKEFGRDATGDNACKKCSKGCDRRRDIRPSSSGTHRHRRRCLRARPDERGCNRGRPYKRIRLAREGRLSCPSQAGIRQVRSLPFHPVIGTGRAL